MEQSEWGEIEVELQEYQLNLLNRLVTEGFYGSQGEAVSAVLSHQETEEIDPQVKQRIGEITEICTSAESSAVAHFFADTTEIMHLYAKIMDGEDEMVEDMNSMYQVLQDYVMDPQNRDEELVDIFVEGLFDYASELDSALNGDSIESARADNYLDKYDPQLVRTIL